MIKAQISLGDQSCNYGSRISPSPPPSTPPALAPECLHTCALTDPLTQPQPPNLKQVWQHGGHRCSGATHRHSGLILQHSRCLEHTGISRQCRHQRLLCPHTHRHARHKASSEGQHASAVCGAVGSGRGAAAAAWATAEGAGGVGADALLVNDCAIGGDVPVRCVRCVC